ncbi:MAG: restriction endonuclease subunit S [Saprospiraceae bacterium]|nr:restriction endonuclease subunit S [Saprospiraceae bacterium]
MSEWKEIEFYKMLIDEIISYGIVQPGFHTEINSVPIIRVNNIKDGKIKIDNILKVDKSIEEKYQRTRLKGGELLITVVGNVGECAIVPPSLYGWNVARAVSVAKIKDEFDIQFIRYAFKTEDIIFQMYGNTNDTVQPTLNLASLKALKFSLPPLPEQRAIASILSSLDDKIDLLHHQNATLEKLAETLFRQWFVEEAGEEWEEKKLGDLLTITSSKRIFYSEYVSIGIPFYRSKEIIELRSIGATSSELYISPQRFEEIESKFGSPEKGDILLTSVGTLGVAYRVKSKDKFYFKDGNLTWFKDFNIIPSSIIYFWLISKVGQEELASITIGSTQQALTIEGLKSIMFKVPPAGIIKKCEKELEDIISKIEANQTQIRTLTAMRDSLLPKLMSGEVKVESV